MIYDYFDTDINSITCIGSLLRGTDSGIFHPLAQAQPAVLTKPHEFSLVVVIYSCVLAALSIVGITLGVVDYRLTGNKYVAARKLDRVVSRDEVVMWILAILVILIQVVMSVITQSFDGDDAYYVVQSLLTVETDTMYSIKPYTGLSTAVDLRHALAAMPMWVAYLSRISGIHPTIISHTCLGVILIPLLYMIYYQCGKLLFRKDSRRLPIFLIFVSILYVFGNVSIYTNETFMMTYGDGVYGFGNRYFSHRSFHAPALPISHRQSKASSEAQTSGLLCGYS